MLENCVADRERFVNDQNVRFDARGDGKSEADIHTARISLDWLVKKRSDFRKPFDSREERSSFAPA